jgi:CxxC motif-containing protein (DUF1111 family)
MTHVLSFVWLAGCALEGPALEHGEWLPGGDATNRVLLGIHAFETPAANLDPAGRDRFFAGRSFFTQSWVTAPASASARDGLGPTFQASSCAGCHVRGGRGRPESPGGLVVKIAMLDGTGAHPRYGAALQTSALRGVPVEGSIEVGYRDETIAGVALRAPEIALRDLAFGSLEGAAASARVAPPVFGVGLLELVPDESILAREDPEDRDGDGISGRASLVRDEGGELVLGRFGWRAEQPTVRAQIAAALLGDLGITTAIFPEDDCPAVQRECAAAPSGGEPELDGARFEHLVFFGMHVAVPARTSADDPEVLRGKALFAEAGCDACHVPVHETRESDEHPALSQQTIRPYTDLLLHDMGPELADGFGREWRTPPLWGLGRLETVNGHTLLLHDGRARNVEEAIVWHGGEGKGARDAFANMDGADRAALIRFVESL